MSKSKQIRQILERDADAKPAAIIAELADQGVDVSKDLIKKVRLDWRIDQKAKEEAKRRSQGTSSFRVPTIDSDAIADYPPKPDRKPKFPLLADSKPWGFRHDAFLKHFAQYLTTERNSTVKCACVKASPEAWFQIEALSWLNANRELVGIGNADWWGIYCEKAKTDLWLQYAADYNYRRGVAIELKVIFNNKNFRSKVREIRSDLSPAKRLPRGFTDDNTQRFSLVIVTCVRYSTPGGYKYLREEKQIVTQERFHEMIDAELTSESDWYKDYPPARQLGSLRQIAVLDGEPGIDPESEGNGVWLGLVGCRPMAHAPS